MGKSALGTRLCIFISTTVYLPTFSESNAWDQEDQERSYSLGKIYILGFSQLPKMTRHFPKTYAYLLSRNSEDFRCLKSAEKQPHPQVFSFAKKAENLKELSVIFFLQVDKGSSPWKLRFNNWKLWARREKLVRIREAGKREILLYNDWVSSFSFPFAFYLCLCRTIKVTV